MSLRRVLTCLYLPCAYTLFMLVYIARYVLSLYILALQGLRLKYSVNMLLTCILHCNARPSYFIRTDCKCSSVLLLITNIIFFLSYLTSSSFSAKTVTQSLSSRKLSVCLEMCLCFLYQFDQVHSKGETAITMEWDCTAQLLSMLILLKKINITDFLNIQWVKRQQNHDHAVNCHETDLLNL